MMILIAMTVITSIQPPVYKTLTCTGKDKRGERSHAQSLISLIVSVIIKHHVYFKGHALLGRFIQQSSQNNLDKEKKEA